MKSGYTLQSLTAWSVGDAEFYAVVKGGQVGRCLRSKYMDLGIPMKVQIHSDSSTANSLTDRLGAGPRTKHIDTRSFWVQERVQDDDLSIKKVLTAKMCADVGMKPVSAFCVATTLQVCRIDILLTVDPTLHNKKMGHLLNRADVGGAEQTMITTGFEHRDGCKAECVEHFSR